MKKFLLALLILLTSVFFVLAGKANFVFAQSEGASCCQTGYRFSGGGCIRNDLIPVCNSIASSYCALCSSACPALCTNTISTACQSSFAAGQVASGREDELCAALGYALSTAFSVPSFGFQMACVAFTQPILSGISGLTTTPATCDSGLRCSTSGVCEKIPVLTPYNPECSPGGTHGNNYGGVKTALGCLPTDPQAFIYIITPWAIGIGAGIAFLLGLYGSLMIVISAGDPEKMQAGKEIITSAIAGSLLITFAVFILRIIGVDILKLF
jgi:hypothetical protein